MSNPDFDASFIVLAATRYAIGRQTFAPKIVADYIAAHPDVLTEGHRKQLASEIRESMDEFSAQGMIADTERPTWERVLAMLEGGEG